MPVYEYHCPKCQVNFELMTSVEGRYSVCHPACQTPARRIWLHPPGIQFLGEGWSSECKFISEHESKVRKCRRDEKAENEVEYQKNMERAFSEARDPTDSEAEEADRIAHGSAE